MTVLCQRIYRQSSKRIVLSTSVAYCRLTWICLQLWQEWIFGVHCAHWWCSSESRPSVITSTSFISLAVSTFSRISGWKTYAQQYKKRILLAAQGEWSVSNCERLLQMHPTVDKRQCALQSFTGSGPLECFAMPIMGQLPKTINGILFVLIMMDRYDGWLVEVSKTRTYVQDKWFAYWVSFMITG